MYSVQSVLIRNDFTKSYAIQGNVVFVVRLDCELVGAAPAEGRRRRRGSQLRMAPNGKADFDKFKLCPPG